MKKLIIIIGIITIVFAPFYFAKDRLISAFVNSTVSKFLGVPVKISGLSWDIVNSTVRIESCKIFNPEGFPKGLLVDIGNINCEYDLSPLLKKELHFILFELTLKELVVIKDKNGKFNLDALMFVQEQASNVKVQKQAGKQSPMHIDLFKFAIEKVVYKDFSAGGKPLVEVRYINLKKAYSNINSAEQLGFLLFSESVKSFTITGLKACGLAAVTGVYFLPVAAVGILTDKDSSFVDFNIIYDPAYKISLKVVDELGDIIKQDISTGIIKGKIHGADVVVRILQKEGATLRINVSARDFLFPKPAIAEGVLYEIVEKINALIPQ